VRAWRRPQRARRAAAFVLNKFYLLYKLYCDSCSVRRRGEGRTINERRQSQNFAMVATSVLVALIAGWLAGRIMKDGGHGLKGDMIVAQRKLWEGHA
jgi:hypothetical protein